jgi:hypothetical protein
MKKLVVFFLGISLLSGCSGKELPLKFIRLLDRANMIFYQPDGYNQIDSIKNNLMDWQLAYVHAYEKFEVRYMIKPMDKMLKEYKEFEAKNDSGQITVHPNKLYNSSFKSLLMDVSGGELPEYNVFSPAAAKNEFNADWGASATVNAGNGFGDGYKYCYIVSIHKDNIGDAYAYYFADNIDLLKKEVTKIVHNLKFNK